MDLVTLMFLGLYALCLVILYKIIRLGGKIDSVKSGGYDPAVTVWKFFLQLLFGGSSLVLLDFAGNYLTQLQQLNTPISVIVIIAILNALVNFIKHR